MINLQGRHALGTEWRGGGGERACGCQGELMGEVYAPMSADQAANLPPPVAFYLLSHFLFLPGGIATLEPPVQKTDNWVVVLKSTHKNLNVDDDPKRCFETRISSFINVGYVSHLIACRILI